MSGVSVDTFWWGFQITLSNTAVIALTGGSSVVGTVVVGLLAAQVHTLGITTVVATAISLRVAACQFIAGSGGLVLSSPWPMPLMLTPWPVDDPKHNMISYTTFQGGRWAPVAGFFGKHITEARPNFAIYQDSLFMFYQTKEESIVYTKYHPEKGFGDKIRIEACKSKFDVAAMEYKEDLHVVHRGGGSDTSLWHIKLSGGIWSKDKQMANMHTIWGPAMGKFCGYLHVVALGAEGNLWTTMWNGAKWSAYTKMDNVYATAGPALVQYNDFLYCVARGRDSKLWWMTHDGVSWGPYKQIKGGYDFATGAPALCTYNDNLFCAARGNDGDLWFTIYDGRKWSDYQSTHIKLAGDPALINFQSQVAIPNKPREVMCAFQTE
ncbi:hypothetical protein F5B18DRAFT_461950 [Nemania serpens]|nr:hypothetical protein F5B18DRAFT_461950 [Nemania serpens]